MVLVEVVMPDVQDRLYNFEQGTDKLCSDMAAWHHVRELQSGKDRGALISLAPSTPSPQQIELDDPLAGVA